VLYIFIHHYIMDLQPLMEITVPSM